MYSIKSTLCDSLSWHSPHWMLWSGAGPSHLLPLQRCLAPAAACSICIACPEPTAQMQGGLCISGCSCWSSELMQGVGIAWSPRGKLLFSHCCLVGEGTSILQFLGSAQDQCTCSACFLPGLGNAEAGGGLTSWHPFSTEQVLPGGLQPSQMSIP